MMRATNGALALDAVKADGMGVWADETNGGVAFGLSGILFTKFR
jgi:hypothetical protein